MTMISRRRYRRAVPTLLGILGLLALGAVSALGATRTGVTVTPDATVVTPALGVDYGVYNFTVDFAGADDAAAGFVKGPKVGHCVDSALSTSSTNDAVLRTGVEGADLALNNGDLGNLTVTTAGRNRLEWLLLSSRRALADLPAGPAANFELAAHQKAIWVLTNPSTPGQPSNPSEPLLESPQFLARADQLVADSATYGSNVARQPSIAPVGAAVCGGATRTLGLVGAPLTSVTLQISGGVGQFVSGAIAPGGQQTSVLLGPDGAADVGLTGPIGTVAVSGTFQVPTLVQADIPTVQRTGQDFAYLEFRPATIAASVAFVDCTTPPPPTPPSPTPSTPTVPTPTQVPPPVVTGVSVARLTITKTGPRSAIAGDVVDYVIRVRNTSSTTATDLVVTDIIPPGYVRLRAVPDATFAKGRLTWRVSSLAPATTRTFRVRFRIDRTITGTRCNNVSASAANASGVRARACTNVLSRRIRTVVPAVTG